jgi:hypothetical protein
MNAKEKRPTYMYRVGLGQTPAAIAHHMTGNAARAHELVPVNPQKRSVGVGRSATFQSLRAGEMLHMPRSWVSEGPKSGGPKRGFAGMPLLYGLGADAGTKTEVTGTDTLSDPVLAAAVDLDNYLGTNGCDCTTDLVAVTKRFQVAFNAAVSSGAKPGPAVGTDGKYGPGTQNALNNVLGHAPSPCWGQGNPCFGKAIVNKNGGVVVPPPALPGGGGGGTIPTPKPGGGGTTPVTVVTGSQSSILPWVLGGLAVAAGVGVVAYVQHQKKAGKPLLPTKITAHRPVRHLARRRRR